MQACAPGKLILSGEHSAVYGAPALALAVKRHIICHSSDSDLNGLSWSLPELQRQGHISWSDLVLLAQQLDDRFAMFERKELPVAAILQAPEQLLLYAIAQLLPRSLPVTGISIEVNSQLPPGAGMGSSAAASAAILTLFSALFNRPVTIADKFRMVRYCERLCHGRGGLIDAATVTHGGLIQVQDGEVIALSVELGEGWFYVNSGIPSASTGECVEQVRQQFVDDAVWSKFADLTKRLLQVISDGADPTALIQENHRLLQYIGVVPERVSRFIERLEQLGAAAKISGAGSVTGSAGGALLVYAPGIEIETLCTEFSYDFMAIEEDSQGARLCN